MTRRRQPKPHPAFRMPSMRTIMSRKTSITHAFANAIVPQVMPTIDEVDRALTILGMKAEDVRCAYCGDRSSEWDHLRAVVHNRRATGYISEIGNLVPACGKCNQSRGNKPWREWMCSSAARSPKTRGIPDIATRMDRLEAFERWRAPVQLNVEGIIGQTEWENYWRLCDSIVDEMKAAQVVADDIKRRVALRLTGGIPPGA